MKNTSDTPEILDSLNRFVDVVLAYRPKPKTKAAKKRKRKKTAQEKQSNRYNYECSGGVDGHATI